MHPDERLDLRRSTTTYQRTRVKIQIVTGTLQPQFTRQREATSGLHLYVERESERLEAHHVHSDQMQIRICSQ